MKRIRRDWFFYPQSDRRVFLLVCCLLLLSTGSMVWLYLTEEEDIIPQLTEKEQQEFRHMANSMVKDTVRRKRTPRPTYRKTSRRRIETFAFDPNTADSSTLLRLGFLPWQIRNIHTYRARGGRYRKAEDFKRLYGMTEEMFERLRPYIRIDSTYRLVADTSTTRRPHFGQERPVKLAAGMHIDLNQADTTALQSVPGIGRGYAALIARYRERLGGFVSTGQLKEIEQLPDSLEKWFVINEKEVKQMNLNHLNIDRLRSHPYLNFRQSRTILEHRRKFGPLKSLRDLRGYDEFSEKDFERLQPYVCF